MGNATIVFTEQPGVALRVMRAAAGVQSGQLSKALGIHPNTLREYEACRRQVPASVMARARELLAGGTFRPDAD